MTCNPSCSCNEYHESDVCLCGCDILDELSYKIPEDQWVKENKKRTLIKYDPE